MGNIKGAEGTGTLIVSRQATTLEGKPTVETRIEYKQVPKKGGRVFIGDIQTKIGRQTGSKPNRREEGLVLRQRELGGEIVKFISGCDNTGKKYQDQFNESIGPLPLTKSWTKYVIDLSKLEEKQLSSVIGPFAWVVDGGFDKDGRVVVYIPTWKWSEGLRALSLPKTWIREAESSGRSSLHFNTVLFLLLMHTLTPIITWDLLRHWRR